MSQSGEGVLSEAGADAQRALDDAVAQGLVPGASLSVFDGAGTLECAAGVANVETGQPVSTSSLFLIGSITKMFTGALVMGLVEDGRLALEDRVLERLPELRFAAGPDPAPLTVADLLRHRGGVESDQFGDFGRGDDALARMVATMAELPLQFPPGARFAYSNSGTMILGRLAETVAGKPFAHALRERVLEPLGAATATSFAEQAILRTTAVGHFPDEAGRLRRVRVWGSSRASEPDGMLCAPSGEVLRLAVSLMRSLQGREGELLAPATVARMVADSVAIPAFVYPGEYVACGLGIMELGARSGRLFGHNGSIMGQGGMLRLNPDLGTAAVLLTNGTIASGRVWERLLEGPLGALLGVATEDPRTPTGVDADVTGSYERLNCTVDVDRVDGELRLTVHLHGPLLVESGGYNPFRDVPLVAVAPGAYQAIAPGAAHESYFVMTEDDGYAYFDSRLLRRRAS